MNKRHPITPVAEPTVIKDFYEPHEVDAMFGVLRDHAPWKLILAHHFKSTEEYLAVSGAAGVDPSTVTLSDFIAPVFRGYFAEAGVVYYPELHDLYLDKKLLEPVLDLHGAKYGMAEHMLFNTGVPCHSFDAGHFDTPKWRGASIVDTPLWLLSVMAKSGLFDHWEVRVGQMITYFYDSDLDGGFTYWPDGPEEPAKRLAAPFDNACVLSDNSRMYHRRESFGPRDKRDYPDLRLESLLHSEGDEWVIRNEGSEIARYGSGDMRTLFHYTATVFDELADVRRYLDHTDDLTHDKIFEIVVHDLNKRGVSFAEPSEPLEDGTFIDLLNRTYETSPTSYPPEAPMAVRGAA